MTYLQRKLQEPQKHALLFFLIVDSLLKSELAISFKTSSVLKIFAMRKEETNKSKSNHKSM